MRIRFDLHQLNIFCTIIDLESFSKASRKLHLSQPTLSTHIKQLEENCGTELLDRSGRKILPTKSGEVLYEYARKILSLSREAEGALDEFVRDFQGEIRLGATPYLGEYVLPEKIAEFHASNPKVKISLEIAKGKEIIQKVESGRLDLGAVGRPGAHPRLSFAPFFEDRFVFAAPAGHPLAKKNRVSAAALGQSKIILREEGSQTRKAFERLLEEELHAKRISDIFPDTMEFGSCSAVREGMKNGLGIAFLPEHSIREELKNGTFAVLKLPGTPIPRKYYLVFTTSWGESPLGKTFLRSAQE